VGVPAVGAPSRGRSSAAWLARRGVGGGGVLFFDEEKRSGTRGGCGGVKMPHKTERESSELWKGACAKAEYFAVLEGHFRWPMT
jgi:hypothetical protein